MRRLVVDAANFLTTPFGAKLVRADAVFDMWSAMQRIVEHEIPVRTVIDIGASNGKWSAEAMRFFPKASFLAIEPLYERQGALERLRQNNNNFDHVLCVAGDKDGEMVNLNVSDDLDGSTVDGSGGNPRNVPVRTLDALIAERGLQGPFLLKFDTHGYEVPILSGATNALENTNVIIMETYNFKVTRNALRFHEMCSYLEKLRFRCYDIAGPMLRFHDKALWQMDLFFTRDESEIFSHPGFR